MCTIQSPFQIIQLCYHSVDCMAEIHPVTESKGHCVFLIYFYVQLWTHASLGPGLAPRARLAVKNPHNLIIHSNLTNNTFITCIWDFVSQLIRYARACSAYEQFLKRKLLTNRLEKQDYQQSDWSHHFISFTVDPTILSVKTVIR